MLQNTQTKHQKSENEEKKFYRIGFWNLCHMSRAKYFSWKVFFQIWGFFIVQKVFIKNLGFA